MSPNESQPPAAPRPRPAAPRAPRGPSCLALGKLRAPRTRPDPPEQPQQRRQPPSPLLRLERSLGAAGHERAAASVRGDKNTHPGGRGEGEKPRESKMGFKGKFVNHEHQPLLLPSDGSSGREISVCSRNGPGQLQPQHLPLPSSSREGTVDGFTPRLSSRQEPGSPAATGMESHSVSAAARPGDKAACADRQTDRSSLQQPGAFFSHLTPSSLSSSLG